MKKYLILGLLVGTIVGLSGQGSGTGIPSTLRVLTDANLSLLVTGVAQSSPISQPTVFSNTRLKTAADGSLQVVLVGGATITGGTCTNQAVTAISTTGVPTCTTLTSAYVDSSIAQVASANLFTTNQTITKLALGTTSTNGLLLTNTTLATAGVPVQISPNTQWSGTAYNSVSTLSETDFFVAEVLPVTNAGTTTAALRIGASIAGGAVGYGFTFSNAGNFSAGSLTSSGFIQTSTDFRFGTGTLITDPADGQLNIRNNANTAGIGFDVTTDGTLKFRTRAQTGDGNISFLNGIASGNIKITNGTTIAATTNKLIQVNDNANATGLEFNAGTPTLGTCTGGSITSGSHNSAGEVTGNTSGSCIINFGIPNFTNIPYCTINDESALIAVQISSRSTSSMTITGLASGNNAQWICIGRIGT